MFGTGSHRISRFVILAGLVYASWMEAANAVEVSYVGSIRDALSAPTSLAASVDQIAALQPYRGQILVLTPGGALTRRIDVSGRSHGLARLSSVVYVYCDAEAGRLVAVDISSGRQWTLASNLGNPVDVAVASGECHVLDAASARVVTVNDQGAITGRLELAVVTGGSLTSPAALTYDEARQAFHVFDQVTSRAHIVTRSGAHIGTYGTFGSAAGTITRGGGVACDGDGYTYIVDRYQGRIAVFDPDGKFVTNIDTRRLIGIALMVPTGIAVDANGIVYVSSTEDNRIHIFSVDKTVLPAGDLAAAPLFPVSAGTLPVADVELVARVAGTPQPGNTLFADFRVVKTSDPETVMAEAVGVEPSELGTDDAGRLVGTVAWRPGDQLEAGEHYQWQTRARTQDRVGPWCEPVSFATTPPAVRYQLEANYPNPFNPYTTIAFSVPAVEEVVVEIFDLRGARIWHTTLRNLTAGRHTLGWDARNDAGAEVASGVYFYRLRADDFEQTRKMVLVR